MILARKYNLKSIVAIFGLTMLFACKTNPQKMEDLSKELIEPVVSTRDVSWLYTKNGKASFNLTAPIMERYEGEKPYSEFVEGLVLESFERAGTKDAFLKADYAIQHINEQLIEAKGNVLLQNEKGERLETEYLVWDEKKERIYTEEFVKITQEKQVIMGEGFESDIYFSEYTLKKSRGIINLEHAE